MTTKTKLKFSLLIFGIASVYLPFGWITPEIWQTVAIAVLGIFSVGHVTTDVTAIVTGAKTK